MEGRTEKAMYHDGSRRQMQDPGYYYDLVVYSRWA